MSKNLLNIQELAMTDDYLDPPEHVVAGRAQFEPYNRLLKLCRWPVVDLNLTKAQVLDGIRATGRRDNRHFAPCLID